MSRRYSLRGGRRGSVVARVGTPIAPEVPINELLPNFWFRADNVTLTGANVATIPNKVGTDILTSTGGALPAPAPDPLFNNAQSLLFTGTQWLDSNLAGSAWKFLYDGTGFEAFHVFASTAASTDVQFATIGGTPGLQFYTQSSSTNVQVYGGAIVFHAPTPGGAPLGVATYSNFYYSETTPVKCVVFIKDVVATVPTIDSAPSADVGAGYFRMGATAISGANPTHSRWCETLIFKRVLSEAERQTVREYLQNRYGFAAPVVSGSEKTVLKLKPRNWIRAQESVTSGGFVTAFNDKAMPGHKLQQATPAQQVAVPVADPLYANKLTANFAGAQWYDSTLPPSAWQFFHDGTGSEFFLVATLTPGNPSVSVPLTTRVSGTGVTLIHASSSAAPYIYIQNGANVVTNQSEPGTINWPVSTGTYISYAFKNSAPMPITGWVESAVSLASKPTNPFITGLDPSIALRLGSTGSTEHVLMKWAEVLVFNRALTEIERQTVRDYIQDRYAILAPTINANDRPILELQPRNWFRASNFTTAGANVDKFYDKVQPGHVLAQATPANQVAAPLSDPLFANALSANFTGTQWYNSNALPSAWQFLNDGSGCEEFTVYQSPATSPQLLWATGILVQDVRSQRYVQAPGQVMVFINGISLASPASTQLPGDAFYGNFFCKNGAPVAAVSFAKSNVAATVTSSSLPQVPPATSLSLGANAIGELGITMRWCESLFFNRVLTEYERQQVREYIQAQYGIAAPIVSAADKAIFKLKPRNWLRADSATVAAGRATELLDKAMPGAKLTQATTPFQGVVVTDPVHGGKPAVVFTNATGYTSNLAPAAWAFLHSGSGSDMRHAYRLNTLAAVPGNSVFLSTTNTGSQNGVILYLSPGGSNRRLYQVFAPSIVSFSAAVVNDLNPTLDGMVLGLASTPDFRYLDGTSLLGSADVLNAPNAGDPQSTLSIGGGGGGGGGFEANWTESLFFDRVLNAAEEQILLQYYAERYAQPAVDKPIFDLQPFSWFRSDSYTTAGANVAAFTDRIKPGHSLVQATPAQQVAIPTADPLLGGKPSANFLGAQYYDSNLAGAWQFMSDGTGFEVFHVLVPEAATFIVSSTLLSATGHQTAFYVDGASDALVRNDSNSPVVLLASAAGTNTANSPTYLDFCHKSTDAIKATLFAKGSIVASTVSETNAPSASPGSTFCLGSRVGDRAVPARMKWVDTLIFNRVLSEYERQQVREYIQARYGIAAPAISSEDREILAMKPFSWVRADSVNSSDGKVTSFKDLAMPGHLLVQPTVSNQALTPVADANFNGQLAAAFGGTATYESNLLPASWTFLHDGTGAYVSFVFKLNDTVDRQDILRSVGSPVTGVAYIINQNGQHGPALYNNGSTVAPLNGGISGTLPKYFATAFGVAASGDFQAFNKGVLAGAADVGATPPASTAPGGVLRYGAIDAVGNFGMNASVPELWIIFNRLLTPEEVTKLRNYYFSRYGITP